MYQMGDFEGCKHAGEEVCIQANRNHSTNYNALVGRAKSVVSGAFRMEEDFEKAEELLDSSTEVCCDSSVSWYLLKCESFTS